MPKQISDSQDFGLVGESVFQTWATKMGWYSTRLVPDHGIDFVCQIRGDRIGKRSWEMSGKTFNVSVRSTKGDSDTVTIDRSDAELIFSTTSPIILAIVRRAPPGQADQVAIKFVDEEFVRELDVFLQGTAKTHTVRFSDAITDRQKIDYNVERLFKQSYADTIARLRAELRLKDYVAEPYVEIRRTARGTWALVHSKGLAVMAEVCQKTDIAAVFKQIDARVEFITSPFAASHGVQAASVSGGDSIVTTEAPPSPQAISEKQGAQVTFVSLVSGSGGKATEDKLAHVSQLMQQMQQELSVWNYDAALVLAEELETFVQTGDVEKEPLILKLLFLLARVHVIRAEKKDLKAKNHIERAKSLLDQIAAIFTPSSLGEMAADIEALKGSVENLEKGPDAALALLAERTDAYAIRIRLAMLLKKQDLDGAVALVEDLPPNERWCDLAVTALALKDRREDADRLVQWAAAQRDRSKYLQCIVHFADALLARSIAGQEKGKTIQTYDVSKEEKNEIRAVLKTLRPVLEPIVTTGQVNSELDVAALKIALQANHLLGKRENVARITRLMYTRRPVPVDVARSVVSGYIEPPSDLPERLRSDYPGDLEANILAAVVESSCQGKHEESFAKAKELLPLADVDEKKDQLFNLFQQIWQELEGDVVLHCEEILAGLASHNPRHQAIFEAAKALRAKDPDAAIQAMDKEKAEDDIRWLQVRANALIQKGQLGEAVDLLLIAAKATGEPALLHKSADFAFQAEKIDLAARCYERLLEMQPNNLIARGNLASIYTFYLHDVEKASVQFRFLHEAEPENQVYAINLAVCLAHLYRPQESLAVYNEACGQDKPDVRAVLGRAELLLSLAEPDAAFASLQDFRRALWNDPSFLFAYMNIAYAAGHEECACEALQALNAIRETGGIEPNVFKMVPEDEGLELLKKSMKADQEKREHLHSEMLQGRLPWVGTEQAGGNAIYWGWRKRTQEMAWIGDDPTNRALFSIYATNAFHARKSRKGRRELLPLECPPAGTRIVADISSLITLHRLELLEMIADYFGEIMVPQGYLATVLEDSRKMVLAQRSQKLNAERIAKKIENGIIKTLGERAALDISMPIVDEHTKAGETRYRLVDLFRPIHNSGLISDVTLERISKVCRKKSVVDESQSELVRFQRIVVEPLTLETLADCDALDVVTSYYNVCISEKVRNGIRQGLEAIRYQEETLAWHFDLWNRVRRDSRFRFVSLPIPKAMRDKQPDPKNFLPFLGSLVAFETKVPLLADDRVCQALTINGRDEAQFAAFGTDSVIFALAKLGKIDKPKTAELLHTLMKARYRFLLPNAEILKVFAEQYRANPPGQALQEVAEYIHDCMRDEGLFGGAEKTERGESMAMRLYLSWLSVISEFLVTVWNDNSFSSESAQRLSEWTVQELLPSPPRVIHGDLKVRMSSFTPRAVISQALFNSSLLATDDRMRDAMETLKNALKLTDNEYLRISMDILNDTQKTARKK